MTDRIVHLLDNDGVETDLLISALTPGVYVCSPPGNGPTFISGPFVWGSTSFRADLPAALEGLDDGEEISLLVVDGTGWAELPAAWFELPPAFPSFGDTLVVEEKQKRIAALLAKAGSTTEAWDELVALRETVAIALSLLGVRWDTVTQTIAIDPDSKYEPHEEWT